MNYKSALLALLIMLFCPVAAAAIEQVQFETPQLEQRYKILIAELRCVVCQNQNLADSDAPLAKDLRTIAADMLRDGASDHDIKKFMTERYGDFVLYEPPFNASTAFLWLGPIGLLLIVIVMLFSHIKRRQQDEMIRTAQASDNNERIRVRNLLRDTPSIDRNSEHN